MSQRKQRVEHALRDVLTDLIATEVKNPRVKAATLITVTRVECNVDMAVANVYVSVVPADLGDDVTAALGKAAGFLRGPVGRRLSLQHAPELRFHYDESVDIGAKLAAIVRDDEERARAVGRVPEPPPAPAPAPVPPTEPPPAEPPAAPTPAPEPPAED